ncbi:KinB signaling pathway activation protein [Paenibacillus sp. VTT E-133280]|uniref:KinB signaling pathway activation protein n=1 Tax=Paenibacillus odorifer TaxID=189426 RepID=A0ABX3H848_9BACL|nr:MULTISPECIES: KinB-signaling pathway activation protein [Paenibacillus]AIQ26214.1 KinB signaling pathway activation protein [Paenibacillus sp. FSL H7-0737]AIQ38052.1 KinB signaling pathway activation protein [Paenibacillus sp. FSL R5-0345]OMD45840.1 KinB signaling pathway activation protein [Paenibacillus odorifer]OZQ63891.1 KinB signaling pathway activation protein [Paenibacillus sp. VTT E-133280]OZQ87593.1 KinB signaling pathway activation protein [Paenibacillus sp. VTT E-133291]
MSIKKWFHLFWTTLLIGAGGAVIAGLALQFVNGKIDFKSVGDFFLYPLILLGYGMLVSVYSQLGFFAYLILNYMGNGVFPQKVWKYIQLVLSVLALLELIFLRTVVGGERNVMSDLILGIVILLAAIIVSYFKVKSTNISALIPTLFFMTAISIVEVIGVLRIGVDSATVFIVVPLIACNAFQILMLHRILKPAAG